MPSWHEFNNAPTYKSLAMMTGLFICDFIGRVIDASALYLQSAAMGIRVPLSQTLFCVAEVSKQSVKYKGQVKDCQIP